MSSYTISQANNQLATIVHEAEQGTPVHLTRRGKPVVVMLNADVYSKLCATQATWWENYLKWRSTTNFADIDDDDIDQIFANVRDRSEGRDFKFDD